MCDYSLHHVATRPAKIEDRLVTTKFHNSITRGFSAIGEPGVAVCLLPGTELAFDREVECEATLPIFLAKKIGQKVARFRQINMDHPTVHHDALEFADGQIVLLTSLCDGQHATVLQMPAGMRAPAEENVQAVPAERVVQRPDVFVMDIPRPTVSKWLQEKTKSKSVLMATTLHILPLAKVLTRKSLAGFRVSASWVGWTKPEGEQGYDRNGAFRGEGQTV